VESVFQLSFCYVNSDQKGVYFQNHSATLRIISELSCTFPIKFDNIKTKRYVTTPSETVLLDVDYELANKNSNQSIKKIEDVDLSEFL
jgi:hypothetical protein